MIRSESSPATALAVAAVETHAIVPAQPTTGECPVPEPEQQLTFGQKAKLGGQAAVAMARNPKAVVALVKYKLAERKSANGAN
jgi:hypothetical protein